MVASKYDLLVVVGDVIPITAAWLTGLPVVTYLVAYSSHYEGKLKLPWPSANCLSSDRFLKIYTVMMTGVLREQKGEEFGQTLKKLLKKEANI